MTNKFAVFDVDGTLHDGALGTEFIVELSRRGYTKHEVHLLYEQWAKSSDKTSFFMEHFYPEFATLLPVTKNVMEQIGKDIASRTLTQIRPEMLKRIEKHRENGYKLLIISTSPSIVITQLTKLLAFDDFEAPPTPFDAHGFYAGPAHRTPQQKNKANQLALLVEKHRFTYTDSWAYGDTLDDLPMLEAVDHPVAVTPHEDFRRIAAERKWEIITTHQ